ncbi:zinc-dependent peptidase [Hanstruepera flava]|uniref:zinc-dependent peptidase n=1 Tax=Hanstruepera flava TaxID=2930218 RepID=UPI002028FC2E|nr:zinc-dependent peptidase [Hanstruepera flava]
MIDIPNLSTEYLIMFGVLVAVLIGLIIYAIVNMVELAYVMIHKKPLYRHGIGFKNKLPEPYRQILASQFRFYNKLSNREKRFFEHRVARFIYDKKFVGRKGIVVSNEMEILISATAVMLTFGYRNYFLNSLEMIIIYPEAFYSKTNDAYHKGEYNPKIKALVLSWQDFLTGYDITNDNLNLGIHEFTHALHVNSLTERHIGATIFGDTFMEITNLLADEAGLRERIIASKYFRDYAFTNQFEFLAVIIESFIETPEEFRAQFPQLYAKTKQMLNFNFANY